MKGFKLLIVSTIFLLGVGILANAQNKVVWQIGEKDNSCEEFALAQNSYRRYSEVFPEGMAVFSVGSGTAKNIPFVIPGPDDAWAGHKEGSILIRFNVADAISPENIELVMDMIAIHSFAPPRLRVTLNDFSAEINLPAGDDQNFLDRKDLTQNSVPVTSKIPSSAIRQGENVLRITNIRGSWTVLDDIRLEASSDIHLKPCQGGVSLAFLKSRPALVYGDSKADLRSPIQATVVNWGKRPVKADYYCNGVKSGVMTLSPGVNTKEITVSGDLQGKKVNIGLVCGRTRTDKDVETLPADKWTVYLVQHTHTDIGYTKPQTEILTEHLRYIDYALEYCEATEEIDRIHENLLFYNEHTFGASESIRNPMCENSQVQWAEKGSYVWEALKSAQMMYEAAAARMQGHLYRAEKPTLTFFNSMTHPRSELVKVYIDYELIPRDRNFTITDGNGNILKWQPLNSRSEGRYYAIYAENIPAMGYRTYELVVEDGFQPQEKYENISETAPSVENNFYKLTFDTSRGGLCSVIDKENGKELIDRNAKWNAGEVIYESLKGDRHQMERKVFKHYSREGMSDIRFSGVRKGSVYTSVFYNGRLRGCSFAGVNVEVRLFNDVKRIELSYSLERLPETDPSGIYVAFPFELQDGKLFFDVPGGTVLAGETQIPRSSAAWNTVQNFTAARNSEMQIIVSTDEIPLFLMGEMMDDPYRIDHRHKGQHLYSWVMNNYWTTNFRASQEGELRWTYSLTSSSNVANSAAAEFGRGNRTPLYARVNPPSATKSTSSNPKEKSFLRIEAANIVTVSCRPTRHGNKSVILNIIETDGKKTNLEIIGQDGKPVPFRTVNALEESLDGTEPRTQLTMLPYSNIFVRIDL